MVCREKNIIEQKFKGVDVIEALEAIVHLHVEHYRSDFEDDKALLEAAACKPDIEDRIFLWLCRKNGTWCFRERDVFLKDTWEYAAACYYAEQDAEGVLAYAVEITESLDGRIMGDIYAMDYRKLYWRIKRNAVPCRVSLLYEKGRCIQNTSDYIKKVDAQMGNLLTAEYQPDCAGALEAALCQERGYRCHFKKGNMQKYIVMRKFSA